MRCIGGFTGRSIRSIRTPPRSRGCRRFAPRASCRPASISRHRRPAAMRPRRRGRLRRGGREVARRHHRRLRGDRRRGPRAAGALVERVRGSRHADGRSQLHGPAEHDPEVRLNASFSPIIPPAGHVALLVAERRARHRDPRAGRRAAASAFPTFVSVGNKADVSGNDLLEYWEDDPATASSCSTSSRSATRAASPASPGASRGTKPIVAVKAGTHARRLARRRQPHRGARRQRRRRRRALPPVRRHPRRDDRRDVRHRGLPRRAAAPGRDAASPSSPTPAAPASSRSTPAKRPGLTVAEFSAGDARAAARVPARRRRASAIRWTWSRRPARPNTGAAIEIALASPDVDALIVIFTPVDPSCSDADLAAIRDGIARARAAGATGQAGSRVRHGRRPAHARCRSAPKRRFPTYAFPENAVARARQGGRLRGVAVAAAGCSGASTTSTGRGAGDLPREPGRPRRRLADRRGDGACSTRSRMPAAASSLARTADEAAALRVGLGFPVAAKLASTTVQHKTELGAVRLN